MCIDKASKSEERAYESQDSQGACTERLQADLVIPKLAKPTNILIIIEERLTVVTTKTRKKQNRSNQSYWVFRLLKNVRLLQPTTEYTASQNC